MSVNNTAGDNGQDTSIDVTDHDDLEQFKTNLHTKFNNTAFNGHEMDRNTGATTNTNLRGQYYHQNSDDIILASESFVSNDQTNSMLNKNKYVSADSFVLNDKKHYHRPASLIIVNNGDCNCDYDNVDDVNVDRNGLINRQPSSTITELISAIDNNDDKNVDDNNANDDDDNNAEHCWNTRDSFNNIYQNNKKRNKQKWSSIEYVKPLDSAVSLIMNKTNRQANFNGTERIFIGKNWNNDNDIVTMNNKINDNDNDNDFNDERLGLINNNNCCDENGDVVCGFQAIDDYVDRDCYDYGFYG